MKIIYRPQRGGLAESMSETKEFTSMEDMLEYIIKQHAINGIKMFDMHDIFIHYSDYDKRTGWNTYHIGVGRYYNENYLRQYKYPQIIGYCTFIN